MYTSMFWQLLRRPGARRISLLFPRTTPAARRGGHASWAAASPPEHFAQSCTWRGHSSVASPWGRHNTEGGSLPMISPYSFGEERRAPGVTLDSGRDACIPLDSYRPPQAGQPPDNWVLSCHNLFASLGAWGLGKPTDRL